VLADLVVDLLVAHVEFDAQAGLARRCGDLPGIAVGFGRITGVTLLDSTRRRRPRPLTLFLLSPCEVAEKPLLLLRSP
jgi:hypothetical protein